MDIWLVEPDKDGPTFRTDGRSDRWEFYRLHEHSPASPVTFLNKLFKTIFESYLNNLQIVFWYAKLGQIVGKSYLGKLYFLTVFSIGQKQTVHLFNWTFQWLKKTFKQTNPQYAYKRPVILKLFWSSFECCKAVKYINKYFSILVKCIRTLYKLNKDRLFISCKLQLFGICCCCLLCNHGNRLRSTNCREFNYLKLCTPRLLR